MKRFLKEYRKFMNINTPQKKVAIGLFVVVVVSYQCLDIPAQQKITVAISAMALVGLSVGLFYMDKHKL